MDDSDVVGACNGLGTFAEYYGLEKLWPGQAITLVTIGVGVDE